MQVIKSTLVSVDGVIGHGFSPAIAAAARWRWWGAVA